jgi:GTP-binding protein LepA
MMRTGARHDVDRVGVFTPKMIDIGELGPGEIGFLNGSIKEVADTRVGDTITDDRRPAAAALPGFKPAQPVVFCGLFPVDAADFEDLRAAMGKLGSTTPASPSRWKPARRSASASAAAFSAPAPRDHPGAAGARVRPRPHRHRAVGHLPDQPDRRHRHRAAQPGRHAGRHEDRGNPRAVDPATVLTPDEYLGSCSSFARTARHTGELSYVGSRAMVQYDLPLNEVVFDFYDR